MRKRFPKKEAELLRNLQAERLNDARCRVYSELAGREQEVPDPANPGQTNKVLVRPSIDEVNNSIDCILRIEIREANLYGSTRQGKAKSWRGLLASQSMTRRWISG